MTKVRKATLQDLPEVVRIYNEAIATTTATFDLDPVTVEDRLGWFKEFLDGQDNPMLVVDSDHKGSY